MLRIVIAAVLLALPCGTSPAAAHPHVFVSYAVALRIGAEGPTGLTFSWTFDEMYSALVIGDYVKDAPTDTATAALSDADSQRLRDNAFANSAKYHYFIDVWLNRKPIAIDRVTEFAAALRDHRLVYTFTVPLAAQAAQGLNGRGQNELVVVVFDYEYYVEFSLAKAHPVTVEAGDGIAVKCMTYTDEDQPSELGPVSRDVVRCNWRR
jgi:ABC-type uncharacterized transport system substrate-binding protein